mmetsp:Transcript_27428/g.38613  ORF Transcript_27428/g.38613 Transcript_27428/m.38613 type:complete len:377 (-) Transcript_27428:67-1197(-)
MEDADPSPPPIENRVSTEDMMKDHFNKTTIEKSREPISYSAEFSNRSDDDDNDDNFYDTAEPSRAKKVSIIGCGQVGMAIAYAILNQEIAGDISLVDMDGEKLEGEARDLRQGSAFHRRTTIEASTHYKVTENSHLVIVTAGLGRKPGESRLRLVEKNTNIMKSIIPKVLEYSPDTPICIVSNPCDIMTAIAAKIAGPSIPPGRIFGSGTCLDSSRLRSLIGRTLDISGQSVHGYIIGEHGDSSVPVWSSVRIGGVPFVDPVEGPSAVHRAMHRDVVKSGLEVIKRKGYTNWSIGLANAYIAEIVLNDGRSVVPLSTCVRGIHDIEKDVFLSYPCLLGANGVRRLLCIPLTKDEEEGFLKSADTVWDIQKGIWDEV